MAWGFNADLVNSWAYMDNVFNPEECKKIIDYASTKEKEKAKVGKHKLIEKYRKNKIVWLNEKDDLHWAYRKLTDASMSLNMQYFHFDLWGFAEDLQFTQYDAPDNQYKAHVDKTYNDVIRKLSITVQLSDPNSYEGGELQIINSANKETMKKDQGTIIAFPSYTLHQVKPKKKLLTDS